MDAKPQTALVMWQDSVDLSRRCANYNPSRQALIDVADYALALESQVAELERITEVALKIVAQTLNEARFTHVRWQACERINEKLGRAHIPLCLFDHGGIADAGHCMAGG